VLIVAITLALSSFVYSEVRAPVRDQPVYAFRSFPVLGSLSILHAQVNSSTPSVLSELRVDDASSSSGILALEGSRYSSLQSLCAPYAATFFSVNTTRGSLTVDDNGATWIDGIEEASSQVEPGIHELVISGASVCTVTLPDGQSAVYPSGSVSTVPEVTTSPESLLLLIPFQAGGHTITAVFEGAIETYGF
jgi:hypothetical protein